jgi:hypothetical protein
VRVKIALVGVVIADIFFTFLGGGGVITLITPSMDPRLISRNFRNKNGISGTKTEFQEQKRNFRNKNGISGTKTEFQEFLRIFMNFKNFAQPANRVSNPRSRPYV